MGARKACGVIWALATDSTACGISSGGVADAAQTGTANARTAAIRGRMFMASMCSGFFCSERVEESQQVRGFLAHQRLVTARFDIQTNQRLGVRGTHIEAPVLV